MGKKKAEFRVVWVNASGDMGLQNIATQAFLPDSVLTYCAQAAAAC
jgi:hypothetical protein